VAYEGSGDFNVVGSDYTRVLVQGSSMGAGGILGVHLRSQNVRGESMPAGTAVESILLTSAPAEKNRPVPVRMVMVMSGMSATLRRR